MDVTDVAEAVVETAENAPAVGDPRIRAAVLIVGGALMGASLGYILGKRLTAKKYEAVVEEEITAVKETYKRLHKDGEFSTPESTVISLGRSRVEEIFTASEAEVEINLQEYEQTVSDLEYDSSHRDDRPNLTVVNVFDHAKGDTELDSKGVPYDAYENPVPRNGDTPYIISLAEFMDDDNFDKTTVVFYEGDGVLTDENDGVVPEVNDIVGLENLTAYGQGGNDTHTLYIRNEIIKTDFEVCREEGTYAEAIGMTDERNN